MSVDGLRSTVAPVAPEPAAARLLGHVRNAEAAIRGFCQLAGDEVISAAEALQSVEEALGILSRARSVAEATLGRAPESRL